MNARQSDNQDILRLLHAVRQVPQILKRQQRRMLCFFCGTLALVVLGLVVCPRKYISETKLFVRVGRENIGLDPTATTGQTIAVHESRENEITSVLDILQSRMILQGVVDKLGPDLILDGKPLRESPDHSGSGEAAALDEAAALRREKAITHLNDTLRTGRTKKSNVLGITYKDRSPQHAQQILQTFIDEFQAVHIAANRTAGSAAFFEQQADLLRTRFEESSRELNELKKSVKAGSVDQRRVALQNQMSTIEIDMLATQADYDAAVATIRGLTQTLDKLPQKTLTQEVTGFPDDAIGVTRKRLYELELQEQQLLTRFTEKHPLVTAVRRQADAARSILKHGVTSDSQATNADNPAFKQLQVSQLEQQSRASGLSAKLTTLKKQYADTQLQLQELNTQDIAIAELQQRVDLYHDKFTAYSEKHEQSRMDQALEAEKFSNVKVVQPPTFVAKPVSPRKGLTLIVGFLFAVVGAVTLALLSEMLVALRRADPIMSAETQSSDVDADTAPPASEDMAHAIAEAERLVEQVQY